MTKRSAPSLPSGLKLAFSTAATALLLYAGWSCSDDNQGTTYPPGSPCAGIYAGQCGTACTDDDGCPDGLHCAAGKCFAACTPNGGECPDGQICDADGRCTDGGSGGTGGTLFTGGNGGGTTSSSSSSGVGGEGGSCGEVDVEIGPQIPTVMLLIDQSGSMTSNFQGEPRWQVVYDVLMDPQDGVVATLQDQVRFGLTLYTYQSGPICPQLVEIKPPALNNHGTIDQVYSQESPTSNTPTGESLEQVAASLAQFAEPGPKLIILATDGDPDRCDDPNGHDNVSKQLVVDAAQNAYLANVETVIIAVGNQVSGDHQQDVANAGKGLPVPAPVPCNDPNICAPTYEPTTKQAMIDAFTDIINGQRTCVFTLEGEVIPGKECEGEVTLNGQLLGCNDPDGWQLNTPSEIEFVGAACDTIMNDPEVTISVSFPCDTVVPPPD